MTSHLTRRTFLQVTVVAGAGLVVGCTASLPDKTAPTRVPDLSRPHDLAGVLKTLGETTLTLQSASRTSSWPLAPDPFLYAPTGQLISRPDLTAGLELGVWLDAQTQQVTSLQILPPFAGSHDFPDWIQQPTPTGETRQFGSLPLITRAGWGAALPNLQAQAEYGLFDPTTNREGWMMYQGSLFSAFNTVVVHHSALPLADGPLRIQRAHMGLKGYADIGYHFLIDGVGDLYEGRTLRARGAHTGGHNTGTIGVVLLGNFSVIEPFAYAWQTLCDLITYLHDAYHIAHIAGHHDFQPGDTECPGAHLEKRLPALATDLQMQFGTGGYVVPAWLKQENG